MRRFVLGMIGALVIWIASREGTEAAMQTMRLVTEGEPTASIVIAEKATRAARMGACELQWHIREMSGATIPIVTDEQDVTGNRILVGQSRQTENLDLKSSDFESQEYLIRFLPETIVLIGKDKPDYGKVVYDFWKHPDAHRTWPGFWDEQGTLYAAYDFLQRHCDVRWFDHTEFGTSIPSRDTVTVSGSSLRRKPFFHYREACWTDPAEYDKYVALKPRSDADWERYEKAMYPRLNKEFSGSNYRKAKTSLMNRFRLRMREGGVDVPCNHSLYGYISRFWNEKSEHFEEKRPEFFAQGYEDSPPQLCYTEPALVKQVVEDARNFFDGKGKKVGAVTAGDYFAVECMDNHFFCQCERCKKWYENDKPDAEALSNYWFNFINRIARELRKTHPDKYITALAYSWHRDLPEFGIEPNVAVQYCFSTNRTLWRQKDYHRDQLAYLEDWHDMSERTGMPLYLWLYYTYPVEFGQHGNYQVFPGFFAHVIDQQFKMFRDYGIRGMFHCGYGQEVEAYVTYRLMDDPSLDVDSLLDEYFNRQYGKAAGPMKELYLAIEETYTNPDNYPDPEKRRGSLDWDYLGTRERMARFGQLLDQAKAQAQAADVKKRVELFEIGTWDYMQTGRRRHELRNKAPIPEASVPRIQAADGDPKKVDWSKSTTLPDKWYKRGSAEPSTHKFTTQIAHDGKHLFLKLVQYCDTTKLVSSGGIFPYDTWEVFAAGQRKPPYRQFAWAPSGAFILLSHGEVDGEKNVKMKDHGVKVVSETGAADKWVSYLVVPLDELTKDGVEPGEAVYLNFVRVNSPGISGQFFPLIIDTWISYVGVHTTDRMAEFVLENK